MFSLVSMVQTCPFRLFRRGLHINIFIRLVRAPSRDDWFRSFMAGYLKFVVAGERVRKERAHFPLGLAPVSYFETIWRASDSSLVTDLLRAVMML